MNAEHASILAGLAGAIEVKPPSDAVLRSARLALRPLRASDRGEFVRVAARSRSHLDASSPIHREGEADEALFERQLALARDAERTGTGLRLVGVLDDDSIAGAFNLNAISRGLDWSADLNYWIAADRLRQGLGLEGVAALVAHALDPLPRGLGLGEIRAWIVRGNEASERIARRTGFERAGDERSYIQTGDRWSLHDLWTCAARMEARGS